MTIAKLSKKNRKKLPNRFKNPKNSKNSPVMGHPAIITRNMPKTNVAVARNLKREE